MCSLITGVQTLNIQLSQSARWDILDAVNIAVSEITIEYSNITQQEVVFIGNTRDYIYEYHRDTKGNWSYFLWQTDDVEQPLDQKTAEYFERLIQSIPVFTLKTRD